MNSENLIEKISLLIFEKKGFDVTLMNLKNISSFADHFIICTADSDTQVRAISDHIDKSLRDEGIRVWHIEGYNSLNWVLLDYVDVVVHVFKKDARAFYNLEKLWGDAPTTILTDPIFDKKN